MLTEPSVAVEARSAMSVVEEVKEELPDKLDKGEAADISGSARAMANASEIDSPAAAMI